MCVFIVFGDIVVVEDFGYLFVCVSLFVFGVCVVLVFVDV